MSACPVLSLTGLQAHSQAISGFEFRHPDSQGGGGVVGGCRLLETGIFHLPESDEGHHMFTQLFGPFHFGQEGGPGLGLKHPIFE